MFRDKIAAVYEIDISADKLVTAFLALAATETVCILDSCGVNNLGSHLLIAGVGPVSMDEVTGLGVRESLRFLDDAVAAKDTASVFTISYDLGSRLLNMTPNGPVTSDRCEPDIFIARFETLVIHDYDSGITSIRGDSGKFDVVRQKLFSDRGEFEIGSPSQKTIVRSNFTRAEYLSNVELIQERIRDGDTYQTNLTQQLSARLPDESTPEVIFRRLRQDHPAPFSAFIRRADSTVISASPERFFRVDHDSNTISTSPIKGTRPRGRDLVEDAALKKELLASSKDRAENTMIVDLLRNDLGRICEYGSISVEKLCELETHPTFFHLVSTISGKLRDCTSFSDILKAVFPCGSITGAPKISTMRIINEIETASRGLSMGAIGYYVPPDRFGLPEVTDLSVAIRTMVIRDKTATFNVGGGIVIDSDPDQEYEESLTKARALLAAIGGHLG